MAGLENTMLIAVVAAFAALVLIVCIILLCQIANLKREVKETRRENVAYNQKEYQAISHSLNEVYKGLGEMQHLAVSVGDLKKILSNVKTRGIVGEIQLGTILCDILTSAQYDENVFVIPNASERVEYAVKLPGEGDDFVYLPIDAKFPGDSYSYLMDAYQSGNAENVAAAKKQLQLVLRKCAKDIHDKYIEPPYTTDFAVMFLPFEGLYAEAVNMGIIEIVQRDYKVMVAGPSTMGALLNSLQMGFKTLAIQKKSGEVWKVLNAVKVEFDKFDDVLADTQQRLTQASAELDKLIGVRTRAIQRTLRDLENTSDKDY